MSSVTHVLCSLFRELRKSPIVAIAAKADVIYLESDIYEYASTPKIVE